MLRRLLNWLIEKLGFSNTYRAVVEDELPDSIKDRTLYLIGEPGKFWLAIMKCPCGCGDDIQLPMTENARPCWKVSIQNDKPTLMPSVNRTARCKSHFVLRAGRVKWCK